LGYGRAADIIVASQQDPDWGYSAQLESPERLVLDSGRPVLIVPKDWKPSVIGERVVVAWNGRREAARAVFDAIPLLARARQVIVVTVDADAEGEIIGDIPGFDICSALARHGVKCEATERRKASTGGVGSALLAEVRANAADLLVMGCYVIRVISNSCSAGPVVMCSTPRPSRC